MVEIKLRSYITSCFSLYLLQLLQLLPTFTMKMTLVKSGVRGYWKSGWLNTLPIILLLSFSSSVKLLSQEHRWITSTPPVNFTLCKNPAEPDSLAQTNTTLKFALLWAGKTKWPAQIPLKLIFSLILYYKHKPYSDHDQQCNGKFSCKFIFRDENLTYHSNLLFTTQPPKAKGKQQFIKCDVELTLCCGVHTFMTASFYLSNNILIS